MPEFASPLPKFNVPILELFVERLLAHSELTREEQASLASLPFTRVQVAAHRDIVRLGERVDHSCLIERGLAGRFGQTEAGARQFISVHVPGEMVDLNSLMAPEATSALAALTRSTIVQVPHHALREVADRFPAVAMAFWRDCVLQGAVAAQWLVNIGRRDARSRMAHLLCEIAVRERHASEPFAKRYEFALTQEQLADFLGLTSVHVNRTLMALRGERLITYSRGYVDILDWDALAATAGFDPSYLVANRRAPRHPRSD